MTERKPFRQGELLFVPVDNIPEGLESMETRENEDIIVGHSESGHHHVLRGLDVVAYRSDPGNIFFKAEDSVQVIHLKSGPDRHRDLRAGGGAWRVIRQSEELPEGMRYVAD